MSEQLADQKTLDPRKIEGLLLLLGVLLFVQALRYLLNIETAIKPFTDTLTWNSLTSPSGDSYHPLWRFVLIYQLTLQIFFGLASGGLGIMLFQKHRLFPRLFLAFLAFQVLVALSLVIIAHSLTPQSTEDPFRQLVQTICTCTLGAVYILRSDRVKLTFYPQKSHEGLQGITIY